MPGCSYENKIDASSSQGAREKESRAEQKPHFVPTVSTWLRGAVLSSTNSSCWLVEKRLGSKELMSSCPRAFRAPCSRKRSLKYSNHLTPTFKHPTSALISLLHWSSENVKKSPIQCRQLPFFKEIIQKCYIRS